MKRYNSWISIFWQGLLALLPIFLTLYFLLWLLRTLEGAFSTPWKIILGEYYFPGLALISAVVFIFAIGLVMRMYIVRHLRDAFDKFLKKLPLVGEIYSSLKTITHYLSSTNSMKGKEVVMITWGGMQVLGIVTREDFTKAPKGIGDAATVAVYLPMSYQIGGYTVYISKDKVRPVDMTQKEALKWTLMGGI